MPIACPYAAKLADPVRSGNPPRPDELEDNGRESDLSLDPQKMEQVREALELARRSCPAFQEQNQCPFRDSHSPEELRKKMLAVPASHLSSDPASSGDSDEVQRPTRQNGQSSGDISVPFRLALEHVHAVSQSIHGGTSESLSSSANEGMPLVQGVGDNLEKERNAPSFLLEGGCPFKVFVPQSKCDARENVEAVSFVQAMEGLSLGAIMARMADTEEGDVMGDKGSFTVPGVRAADCKKKGVKSIVTTPVEKQEEVNGELDKLTRGENQELRLSKALKRGTTESHRAAENVHFVKNFIKGKIRLDLYKQLVCDLYHIYTALEEALDAYAPSSIYKELYRPEKLDRRRALHHDMVYFFGSSWQSMDETRISVATKDYTDRIRNIGQNDPLLLLAHAYTRYLGDLSGGRVLQRVARRALHLKPDVATGHDGLQFYEFENITEGPKAFKNWYRSTLDNLPLSSGDVSRVVAEANVAFVLNMRVFEELDVLSGECPDAVVRPLSDALGYYDRVMKELSHETLSHEKEGKCPFAAAEWNGGRKQDVTVRGCPVAKKKFQLGVTTSGTNDHRKEGCCPWPFVFLHDPLTGMRDIKTCAVLCALFFWAYHLWLVNQR